MELASRDFLVKTSLGKLNYAMATMASRKPQVMVSRRFVKTYRHASALLQGLIEHEVHDIVRLIRARPQTWLREFDRLAQLPEVFEGDVSSGHRVLATWDDGALLLLAVGGHEVVADYTDAKLFMDRLTVVEAPPRFWPGSVQAESFFLSTPSESFSVFGRELERDWLYQLSDQQSDLAAEVYVESRGALSEGSSCNFLVLGGPGTGKTSVLLNLLKSLAEDGYDVRVELSKRMLDYVDACLPEVQIKRFVLAPGQTCDALLIDDPLSLNWVESRIAEPAAPVVIAACDPFQLPSLISDSQIEEYRMHNDASVLPLDECYRQKEAVGRQTKLLIDKIAQSSPFLADYKVAAHHLEHRGLTYLANNLRFPNPGGHVEIHEDARIEDLRKELKRIRSKPLWRHWPPLLVVVDPNLKLPKDAEAALEAVPHENVVLGTGDSIRGLEYQHVFLFVKPDLFRELLNGFDGSGQAEYQRRRLMRIPFSRAKDSLVTFVAPE